MAENLRQTRSWIVSGLIGLALATGSFLIGWHLSRKPIIVFGHVPNYLTHKGDARDQVRAEVLASMRAFQSGYTKKDPAMVPAFMEQLFPKDRDIVVLGTNSGEWVEGYQQVGEFFANDWRYWGNLQLDVDNAMVSTDNEVAWVTTVGTVRDGSAPPRTIRFTAVLTRSNGRWLFRHIVYQWDDRPESLAELLRRSIPGVSALTQ